jgi:predicted permease
VRSVADMPGIERVALAGLVPMDGTNSQTTIRIASGSSSFSTSPDINEVSAGYFGLLDIPVKQGREFTAVDRDSSPLVAVVNETMARRAWNGDAVGKVFRKENTHELFQVVGVVGDLRHRSFAEDPIPMVYFCATQRSRPMMTLHVRTAVPPRVIAPALQKALHEIDRAAGLTAAETMSEYVDRVILPQRLGAGAAMATAGLELALAVMALYGVIAFAASQRRREIGLRMALGASSRSVIALIMREGLLLTGVGVVLGAGVALVGASGLGSMLIGIGPADPVSFGGATLLLLLVGAAASYVPARSASSVDPSTALRSE